MRGSGATPGGRKDETPMPERSAEKMTTLAEVLGETLDERTNKMLMLKPMDVMEGPMSTHRTIKVRPAGNIKMSDVRSVMAGKAPLMLWEM